MKLSFIFVLVCSVLFGACLAAPTGQYSEVPNAQLTPGEVRAGDLGTILATEAETEAGRPGAAEKRAAWDGYGYPGKSDGQHWEYDDLVPICCGWSRKKEASHGREASQFRC